MPHGPLQGRGDTPPQRPSYQMERQVAEGRGASHRAGEAMEAERTPRSGRGCEQRRDESNAGGVGQVMSGNSETSVGLATGAYRRGLSCTRMRVEGSLATDASAVGWLNLPVSRTGPGAEDHILDNPPPALAGAGCGAESAGQSGHSEPRTHYEIVKHGTPWTRGGGGSRLLRGRFSRSHMRRRHFVWTKAAACE